MMAGAKPPIVQSVAVDLIEVINPRARSQKTFQEIVASIVAIGLKRPITVARRVVAGTVRYDLVCGQGRLEAFRVLGQGPSSRRSSWSVQGQGLFVSATQPYRRSPRWPPGALRSAQPRGFAPRPGAPALLHHHPGHDPLPPMAVRRGAFRVGYCFRYGYFRRPRPLPGLSFGSESVTPVPRRPRPLPGLSFGSLSVRPVRARPRPRPGPSFGSLSVTPAPPRPLPGGSFGSLSVTPVCRVPFCPWAAAGRDDSATAVAVATFRTSKRRLRREGSAGSDIAFPLRSANGGGSRSLGEDCKSMGLEDF